jgi:hypothetical protein
MAVVEAGAKDPDTTPNCSGMYLERDESPIPAWVNAESGGSITEQRVSIGMLTILWKSKPQFILVALADNEGFSIADVDNPAAWADLCLQPCTEGLGGVAVLQIGMGLMITEWDRHWTRTLTEVSPSRRAKVKRPRSIQRTVNPFGKETWANCWLH